jgi:hypothetical protein
MSSSQISDQPLPPEKKRCPHCGEMMPSTAEMCWLCLEKFSIQAGTPGLVAKPPVPAAQDERALAHRSEVRAKLLSLLIGVLIMTVVPVSAIVAFWVICTPKAPEKSPETREGEP